jgi:hypothetical protein
MELGTGQPVPRSASKGSAGVEAGSPSGGVVALPSRGLELHPYVQTAPGKRGPTSTLASMTLSPTGVNAHPATAQRVAHRSQRQAKALTPLTAR